MGGGHGDHGERQLFALWNGVLWMQRPTGRTEMVGVRDQTQSPSFLVLWKLRSSGRDDGWSAYQCRIETRPRRWKIGRRVSSYLGGARSGIRSPAFLTAARLPPSARLAQSASRRNVYPRYHKQRTENCVEQHARAVRSPGHNVSPLPSGSISLSEI